MTLSVADRVFETTTTTGTGTYNLAGPIANFQSFVAAGLDGKKVPYIVSDDENWEIGIGTISDASPDTLTRTTILGSSNAGALVDWGAGTRNVRLGPSAKVDITRDENLNFVEGAGTVGGTGNAHTLTLDPAPKAYSDTMRLIHRAPGANTTAVSINVNSLGVKVLKSGGADFTNAAIASGDLLYSVYDSTKGWFETINLSQPNPGLAQAAALIVGFKDKVLTGLRLSNNATDATNDIDIAAGACISDDGTTVITIAAAMGKQLDVAWAAGGTPGAVAGGRSSAAGIANTTYHVWAVSKNAGVDPDIIIDVSATAPTMPSGYTKKKCIGSIIRSGGAILAFNQINDRFFLTLPITDVNATNPGTAAVARTITAPANMLAILHVQFANIASAAAGYYCLITAMFQADATPTQANATWTPNGTGNLNASTLEMVIPLDSNSQVRTRQAVSAGGDMVKIKTIGWIDTRI